MKEIEKLIPLSQSQLGIYIECAQHPGEIIYHIPFLYKLHKNVDMQRLKSAILKTIEAHPAFGYRFTTNNDGEPVMVEDKETRWEIPIEECDDIEKIKWQLPVPYDLTDALPINIRLITTPTANYFFLQAHHIITDGASMAVLMDDIRMAYDGEAIIPETYTMLDYAQQEYNLRKGTPEYISAKEWYLNTFGGCEVESAIIPDREEPQKRMARMEIPLDLNTGKLARLMKETGVKAGTLFTSAFGYTLSRFTGEQEVLFSTIWHGRGDKRMARTTGMFVKTLPVHCKFEDGTTLSQMFNTTGAMIAGARENSLFSYADLHSSLSLKSNYLFVYQGYLFNNLNIGGYPVSSECLEENSTHEQISIQVYQNHDKSYKAVVEFHSNLYSPELITSLIKSYTTILNGMDSGETRLEELPLVSQDQMQLLDSFNNTAKEYDKSSTITSMFISQVQKTPDKNAVVFNDKTFTYREVDLISNRIGNFIASKGLGKEDVVAVLIPRCEWMAIATIGVLKAGCAYQPLDPTYPLERLQFMIKDAGVGLLIADKELQERMNLEVGEVLFTHEILELDYPESLPEVKYSPSDLFNLLYTSGTTGVPKGCMLEHGNVVAFCNWHRNYFGINEESNTTAYASYGFDASMMEIFTSLTAGATLHIIPEEIRLNLIALEEYFNRHSITNSFMTTQVGYQFATSVKCDTLRTFMVGGEKLAPIEPPKGYRLVNAYGPTECCVCITAHDVEKNRINIPIGKALNNTKLYIVDKYGRRLPVGAAGELWGAGVQVGRGYLNRQDKTDEAFISNPFCKDGEYSRIYRTGDIVRYLPDGTIQFVGRKDSQVKIRGFRIELKEVEGKIREFPGIKDVTVQAFDEEGGGKYIAAYIVADTPVDIDALNSFILKEKPPYMVPAATMQIERIPLNQNQKVDKKALPKPQKSISAMEQESNVPLNILEEQLHGIISEIVGNTEFGVSTILGYAGLTSISSIKLATRIYKKYGVALDSKSLVNGGTIQSIENAILESLLKSDKQESPSERELTPVKSAPLTYAQLGVYYECMKNPLGTTYNIPFSLLFPEGTDAGTLAEKIRETVKLHPAMDIHFETADGDVIQIANPEHDAEIVHIKTDSEGLRRLKEEYVQPFHLEKGPLYRFTIAECSGRIHLLMDLHHLIADGGSIDLFIRHLCTLMEGGKVEQEECSYFEFAHTQKEQEKGGEYARAREYFATALAGCEGCSELPYDFKPKENETGKSERVQIPFSLEKVEEFSRKANVTPAHTMLAAAFYTMQRYTNNRDVYMATVSNGRADLRIADTIGMFVNTLALHAHIKGQSIREFVQQVGKDFNDTLYNENYPFARIAADYNFTFATNYAYQIGVMEKYTIGGHEIAMEELKLESPKQKLDIMICDTGTGPAIQLQYNSAWYSRESIMRFGESMANVVEEFISNPEGNILNVSMIGQKQEEELQTIRSTASGEAPFSLFHKSVEHWAQERPHTPALVACDASYTYEEFNSAANRIANSLISSGVKPGDRIALLLPRTSRLILSMFGVMKAGAAYIPCDPDYPAERINLILEDSDAQYIITTAEHLQQHKGKGIDVEELLAGENAANPQCSITPDNLAYLIYTSGSTGRPKGVMLRHEGICNYLWGHPANVFAHAVATDAERILSVTTISFDAALQDIGTSMYSGKTLVLATEEQANNPIELARFIKDERIDMVSGTPSRWQTWLTSYDFTSAISHIKIARAGGEKFSAQLLEQLKRITTARIFNCYGPTEITVASNNKELTDAKTVTVGRPQLGVKEFIVDSDGNELPVGVVGELYIGGTGVGKGYNNLDEMTAERFVEYKGTRVYKSGDYAKWLPCGDVMILGRTDNQIKLRGLRIELGEIEGVMQKVEGMGKVVILIRNLNGKEHLCAYYTADRPIAPDALKAEISRSLTQYMVPTAYLQLQAMPMTPNGKTDLKALPEPQLATTSEYVEAANSTEKTFCNIFADILQLQQVGAEDNFFELGGTSLVVTRVIIEADKAGLHISYGDVFANPTPRKLALLVSGTQQQEDEKDSVKEYDYTAIERVLKLNTLETYMQGEARKLGNVLVTGATGYLGVHILHHLISSDAGQIYCLVRGENAHERLASLLFYYFEDTYNEMMGKRIHIIRGDVTESLCSLFKDYSIDTVFNCAAIVKHFSEGTEIEDINIGGAEKCIELCLEKDATLVHVSTASTRGLSVNGIPSAEETFTEKKLYMGQFLGNKYIWSKFMAERAILQAVADKGLKAKIMRVGNLAARSTDGEFQINFSTNSFMGRIKVFNMLGCCPYGMMDNKVEFSPINEVSKAIVMLATTPDNCNVFHPYNNHQVLLGDMLARLVTIGTEIGFVETDDFERRMEEVKGDPAKARQLASLLAYQDMAHGQKTSDVTRDNTYTMQVLYRMGYSWDYTSWDYIDRFLKAINGMGFFD